MPRLAHLPAVLALVTACRSNPTARDIHAGDTDRAQADGQRVEAGAQAVDPLANAIADFSSAHGGLHARPFDIAAGRRIFFVGGEVAHGAWIVSAPGAPLDGGTVPGTAPVFEAIELPRAVRVVDVAVVDATPYVLVESVAALNQPAGLRGVVAVGKDGPSWKLADVRSASELRARLERPPVLPEGWDDKQRFVRAAKSPAAFATEASPGGVQLYELWQDALVRPLERLDGESMKSAPHREAVVRLLQHLGNVWSSCYHEPGMCVAGQNGDSSNDEGAFVASVGGRVSIQALYLAPAAPAAGAERTPTVAGGDLLVETWRFSHDAPAPRILAQADVGGGRVFGVLSDGKAIWIVEREGAFSRVRELLAPDPPDGQDASAAPAPSAFPEARVVDLDGDGVAEILVWDTRTKVPSAFVFQRNHGINEAPVRDLFGAEVRALGAKSLDDAERLVRPPAERVDPTSAQACALASKASSARGFRSLAAPGARLILRHDGFGSWTERVIPAAEVKDDDVGILSCGGRRQAHCFRQKRLVGLCELGEDETQSVNPLLHFVRVGGAIKIDVVSVFGH